MSSDLGGMRLWAIVETPASVITIAKVICAKLEPIVFYQMQKLKGWSGEI